MEVGCWVQKGMGEVGQGTDTCPTKREKENHRLKSALGKGYVSAQECMLVCVFLCSLKREQFSTSRF